MTPRLIGYWYSEDASAWPDPRRFVDEAQNEETRRRIVVYLKAPVAHVASGGNSFCRLCGRSNGCAEQSDGYYVWPEGLAHYIEEHAVRLPDQFVQHVLEGKPALPLPEFGTSVDVDWWRDQFGWYDGADIRYFTSRRSVYGSLWLIRASCPTTGEQLSFLRRFDTGMLGTRELIQRLKDLMSWELAADLHVSEADSLVAEAEARGLRLEFRSTKA